MTTRRYHRLLQVRIDDETRELVRRLAQARKTDASTLIRQLVIEEAERRRIVVE